MSVTVKRLPVSPERVLKHIEAGIQHADRLNPGFEKEFGAALRGLAQKGQELLVGSYDLAWAGGDHCCPASSIGINGLEGVTDFACGFDVSVDDDYPQESRTYDYFVLDVV